jgi:hypothetical protein
VINSPPPSGHLPVKKLEKHTKETRGIEGSRSTKGPQNTYTRVHLPTCLAGIGVPGRVGPGDDSFNGVFGGDNSLIMMVERFVH